MLNDSAQTMSTITAAAMARLAKMDPPRINPRTMLEEAKIRILVRCRPIMQVLSGGHIARHVADDGTRDNFFTVYESDAEKIMADVETATAADMAEVTREHDRAVKRWLEANEGAKMDVCPCSMEGAFQHVMGRSMLPLESCEIVASDEEKAAGKARKTA